MPPKSPSDLTDPKVLMCMIDNIEKENRLRGRWTNLHKDLLCEAAKLTREPKNYTANDVSRSLITALLPNASKEQVVAARHKITKPVKDYLLIKDRSIGLAEATMKPIEKEAEDLLKESRVKYLKARANKPPEKKYNFIETTYWKHGWELGKSENLRCPAYGRVFKISHGSRSISGPQPDPEHYRRSDEEHICW